VKDFIKIMKALSDPSRVRIVKMLQQRVMCVCEIQEALQVAQSTASKHLKILEDAGLIQYRKEGLWVNYMLADGSQNPYAAVLLDNLRDWLEDCRSIVELREKLQGIRREELCKKS
jgi:ArsR family transcriptional regulator